MSSPAVAPVRLDEVTWEIPPSARPGMRVPARILADEEILRAIGADRSLEQLANVATLPGIVGFAIAMPDIHQGYGFPVGAVAATDARDGVVSPGGVGYDINCGVRLLALAVGRDELAPVLPRLMDELARSVPTGAGRGGALRLDDAALDRVLTRGSAEVVEAHGLGDARDLAHTESGGALPGADPAAVSARARDRGRAQLGTLGSGNHFLELGAVERIADPGAAAALGLREGEVTALIHSGSRGLGHQVCTDHVRAMEPLLPRWGIRLPDRELACAPVGSAEGRGYLAAMACAANFAWSNRQVLAQRVREGVGRVLGRGRAGAVRQVYDVAHNAPSPRSTAAAGCGCTARGRREPSGPGAPASCRPTSRRPASRCSCPGRWAPPRGCSAAWTAATRPASAAPATAPAGCSRATRPGGASPGGSCGGSSRSAASRSAAPPPAGSPRRRRSPTRTSTAWWR